MRFRGLNQNFTSSGPPQGLETRWKNSTSRYLLLHSVSYHTWAVLYCSASWCWSYPRICDKKAILTLTISNWTDYFKVEMSHYVPRLIMYRPTLHKYCRTNGKTLVIAHDSGKLVNIFVTVELINIVIKLLYEMLHIVAKDRPHAKKILQVIEASLAWIWEVEMKADLPVILYFCKIHVKFLSDSGELGGHPHHLCQNFMKSTLIPGKNNTH